MTIYNILPVMSQGGTIIEIGAHNGEDTERMYNLLKPDRFIVFEPDPRNYIQIEKRNLPITLMPQAVSDKVGETTLWMSGGQSGSGEHTASSSILKPTGHIVKHPDYNFDRQIVVKTTTLDEVVKTYNLGSIKFIWCDAQGSEANIIKGGHNAFSITDFFFCEYSNEELYDGQKNLDGWRHTFKDEWYEVCKWDGDILLKRRHHGCSVPV